MSRKPQRVDPSHRIAGGADARENDPVGSRNLCWIGGHHRSDAEPLEGKLDRSDIAVAEIDDGELHSTPLVLGSIDRPRSGPPGAARGRTP